MRTAPSQARSDLNLEPWFIRRVLEVCFENKSTIRKLQQWCQKMVVLIEIVISSSIIYCFRPTFATRWQIFGIFIRSESKSIRDYVFVQSIFIPCVWQPVLQQIRIWQWICYVRVFTSQGTEDNASITRSARWFRYGPWPFIHQGFEELCKIIGTTNYNDGAKGAHKWEVARTVEIPLDIFFI